jgi:hypothetical protein
MRGRQDHYFSPKLQGSPVIVDLNRGCMNPAYGRTETTFPQRVDSKFSERGELHPFYGRKAFRFAAASACTWVWVGGEKLSTETRHVEIRQTASILSSPMICSTKVPANRVSRSMLLGWMISTSQG